LLTLLTASKAVICAVTAAAAMAAAVGRVLCIVGTCAAFGGVTAYNQTHSIINSLQSNTFNH